MFANFTPKACGLLNTDYREVARFASKYGFAAIEVPLGAFTSVKEASEAGKFIADLGLRWGLLYPPCDLFTVDDETFDSALETMKRWGEQMEAAGCVRSYTHVWPGSDERDYDENFEFHVRRVKRVFDIMHNHGIFYGLEFITQRHEIDRFGYPFQSSLAGVLAIADAVSPQVGFVFDVFHWYCSGARIDDVYLAASNISRLVNLHLCDGLAGVGRDRQKNWWRAMPLANGVVDALFSAKLFQKAGYDGPVMLEPMKPSTNRFLKMPLEDVIAEEAGEFKKFFDAAGIEHGFS